MDLHVIGPLASPAERAAVDAVLGPPESGWVGGARDSRVDGHAARGGHATRARRSQLIPALHAVQSRIGWISQPALNYVCRRLAVAPAEAYGVATFYALFATNPRPPLVAHVCDDIACRLAGAEAAVRRPDAGRRAGRGAGTGRPRDLAAQPVPGPVRPGAGGTGHGRRRDGRDLRDRTDRRGRSDRRPRDRLARRWRGRPWSHRLSGRRGCWVASASSTRRRSTTTGPTAATSPWRARSSSAPRASSPR